jgi:hypothetical protein
MMALKTSSTKPYKGRKYAFDRDQISAWRLAGKSWPWIARRYNCPEHTTVMHAAVRMGCELGEQWPDDRPRTRVERQQQAPVQVQEWPSGIHFEDDRRAR